MRYRRRGSAKAAAVMTLVGGTVVGGSVIAFKPRFSGGDPGRGVSGDAPIAEARQVELDRLATILRGSVAIIDVRGGGGPFTEILVHLVDGPRTGQVEPTELLLLSHARTLGVLLAFRLDPDSAAATGPGGGRLRPIAPSTLADPDFARNWRDRTGVDVVRDVIARGIVGLELAPLEPTGDQERRLWRLTLTWDDGTADHRTTASVDLELPIYDPPDSE